MNTRAFHTTITISFKACFSFIDAITTTVQLLRQLLDYTNNTLAVLNPSTFSVIGPDICTPPMLSNAQYNHTTYNHIDDNAQSSPQIVEEDHDDLVCHCPSFPILAEPHDTHATPLTNLNSCPAVVPTIPVRTIHRKQRSYDLRDDFFQTSLSRRGTPCSNPNVNNEKINAHHDDSTDDPNAAYHSSMSNGPNRPASWPYAHSFPLYKCRIFNSETS